MWRLMRRRGRATRCLPPIKSPGAPRQGDHQFRSARSLHAVYPVGGMSPPRRRGVGSGWRGAVTLRGGSAPLRRSRRADPAVCGRGGRDPFPAGRSAWHPAMGQGPPTPVELSPRGTRGDDDAGYRHARTRYEGRRTSRKQSARQHLPARIGQDRSSASLSGESERSAPRRPSPLTSGRRAASPRSGSGGVATCRAP